MTRTGMFIRLLGAGIAIFAIASYWLWTVGKKADVQSRIETLQAQLAEARWQLESEREAAAATLTQMQGSIDELTEELAKRSVIEMRLRKSVLSEDEPELAIEAPEDTAKGQVGERGPGFVTGILYSEEKSSAVIDNKILYEQDTIHGARVVEIHRDKVEFEKNGERWSQRIQQTPPAVWKKNEG